jgi:hypothetical protein
MASTDNAVENPLPRPSGLERLLDKAATLEEACDELAKSLVWYKLYGEDLKAISQREAAASRANLFHKSGESHSATELSPHSSSATLSSIAVDWPGVVEHVGRTTWSRSSIYAQLNMSERRRVSWHLIRNRDARTVSFVRLLGWNHQCFVLVDSAETPAAAEANPSELHKLRLLQHLPSHMDCNYIPVPLPLEKVDENTSRAFQAGEQLVAQLMKQMEKLPGADFTPVSSWRGKDEGTGGVLVVHPLAAVTSPREGSDNKGGSAVEVHLRPTRATKRVSMEVHTQHTPSASAVQLEAASLSSDAAPPTAPDADANAKTIPETSSSTSVGSHGDTEENLDRELDASCSQQEDSYSQDEEDSTMYVPQLFGPPILPKDTWETVWKKLEFSDWSLRRATEGGSPGFVYTKANCCSSGPDAVLNRDYFTSLDELQKFVRAHYGWKGPALASVDDSEDTAPAAIQPRTPSDAQTKPQDPAEPRLSVSGRVSILSYDSPEALETRYHFASLWRRLKKRGWTHRNARNALGNWEYLPPPGLLEGDPVFENEEAVVDAIKKLDGFTLPVAKQGSSSASKQRGRLKKNNFEQRLESAASLDDFLTRPERSKYSKVVTFGKKKAAKAAPEGETVTVQSKKRGASQPLDKGQGKRSKLSSENWWKSRPVPSDDEVWPILERLGYYVANERKVSFYYLPHSMYESFPRDKKVRFKSLQELRVFFACYGLPPTTKEAPVRKSEQVVLDRWVTFANVPVTHANSVQELNDELVVKNPGPAELKKLLLDHQFETVDGMLYLPGASSFGRKGNTLERRVHVFSERDDLESHLRPYLRGCWASVCTSDGSSSRRGRWQANDGSISVHVENLTSNDYYKTLSLRLWAATSKEALPVFTKWPPEKVLVRFFEYDVSSRVLEPPDSSERFGDTTESDEDACVSDPAGDATERKEDSTSSPGSTSTRSSLSDDPSLWENVWPVLKSKLGFTSVNDNEGFSHPKFGEKVVLSTPEDLAKYLCKHGIPEYEEKMGDVPSSLRDLLERWVKFAYVPPNFHDLKIPDENKCLATLRKLRWERVDGKHFVPGNKNRANRIEGRDFFKGIDNLRLYLRSAENVRDADGQTQGDVTAEEEAEIRIWAAAVRLPLPTFREALAPGRTGRRHPLADTHAPPHIRNRQSRGRHTSNRQRRETYSPILGGSMKSAILSGEGASPYLGRSVDSRSSRDAPSAPGNGGEKAVREDDGPHPTQLESQHLLLPHSSSEEAVEMETTDVNHAPGLLTQQGGEDANDDDGEGVTDDEMDEDDCEEGGKVELDGTYLDVATGADRDGYIEAASSHEPFCAEMPLTQYMDNEDDEFFFFAQSSD